MGRRRVPAQGRTPREGRAGEALKPTTPRSRILTAARLDRDADLNRDLGAVATTLHYVAGLPADQALTRARETFRAGETVRDWWGRAAASPAAEGATCDALRPAITDFPL